MANEKLKEYLKLKIQECTTLQKRYERIFNLTKNIPDATDAVIMRGKKEAYKDVLAELKRNEEREARKEGK